MAAASLHGRLVGIWHGARWSWLIGLSPVLLHPLQALHRWAQHVLLAEGSVWRAVGILTAAGCLRAALHVLRDAGMPDCAHAFAQVRGGTCGDQ